LANPLTLKNTDLLVVDTTEPSLTSLSSRRQVLTAGLLAAFGSVAAVQVLGERECIEA
jgi:hypothetical protein